MPARNPAPDLRPACLVLLGILLAAGLVLPAAAMKNPAAVYCLAMGYQDTDVKDAAGNDVNICIMPDGKGVGSWEFLRGMAGQQYSYCARQGMGQKTVASWSVCSHLLAESCAVCVAKDGRETEVTKLMNLSFEESLCGDGICAGPENAETCPQDCPHSGKDFVCEAAPDGKCDPDCTGLFADPDCAMRNPLLLAGLLVLIVLVVVLILWYRKKGSHRKP